MIKKLTLPQRKIEIHVIGCGGTGGYLLGNLGRIIKVRNEEDYNIRLNLYDADTVELKNLLRQNFNNKDIGRSKAESMARKLMLSYQLPATVYREYVETPDRVLTMLNESTARGAFPIIVGCVDSMQCRAIINTALKKFNGRAMWIDAGNEEFFGQAICGTVGGPTIEEFENSGNFAGYFNLPTFVDIAPHLFVGDLQKTSEISCAEHAQENVQNIAANILSATCLFMMLNNLLTPTDKGGGITSSEIYFDARQMKADNRVLV